MSSLALILSLVTAAPACNGDEAEVPLRLNGWPSDDALWLEHELTEWLAKRDRRLCLARDREVTGLTLTLVESEVVVDFVLHGRQRRRADARATASSELFRYQVAATAEELVRATWEELKPPRFALFAQANAQLLASGPLVLGGGLGGRVLLVSSLNAEIQVIAASLPTFGLPTGARLNGMLFAATATLVWLPLKLGVMSAGPRASVQAGALALHVPSTQGITPWVSVMGGVWVGLDTRHFVLGVFGEGGTALVGAVINVDGDPIQLVRGLQGSLGLQAGVHW